MLSKLQDYIQKVNSLDSRSVMIVVVLVIGLSVTYSSISIIQKNRSLQAEIETLQEDIAILDLENQNQKLRNNYYKTDTYMQNAARKYFNKSLPGEQLVIVPKEVAMSYVKKEPTPEELEALKKSNENFIQKSWSNITNFFSGE